MRLIIHKAFFAWNFEKEEKWLNAMSAKGLQLVHAGFFRYVFEENSKERYVYRLELLDKLPSHYESVSYLHFLEETGVEHVDSFLRWVYLRKNVKDGNFQIYSDISSKIKHYKRILFLLLAITPVKVISVINMSLRYSETGDPFFLVTGVLCFLLVSLLTVGLFNISRKIRRLNRDKYVNE